MFMNGFEHFAEHFKNPDRRYAIYPIIHDRIAGNVDIDYYDRCGFAGIVGNVAYTLPSPFDGSGKGFPDDENIWQKTADGFRGFAARGMYTWIYDEKGYPSGTGGG